ncbi:MAG TPA: M28 family peptidase [Actinomycetota bacterium]|nr:M28 family peptidase [Actinomycetota bacterium]
MRHPKIFLALVALVSSGCALAAENVEPGTVIGPRHTDVAPVPTAEPDGPAESPLACQTRSIQSFDDDRAMAHIRALARDIGVRVRGTPGERRAARYAAERFRNLGYDVRVKTFSVDGRTSRNVVAVWPDAIRHPFVLGGHIDTVEGSPGANDNASGVAILLEAARSIAGEEQACLVKFVAFGAEERGADGTHHVGSQVYVNRMSDRARRRTPGMVSVDMVADGRPLVAAHFGAGPEIVWRRTARIIRRAGIDVDRRTMCDCSDNGPFGLAGIPAALLWSGEEPDYHSATDVPRNLVRADLTRSGRAVLAFLRALDRDLIRTFREH